MTGPAEAVRARGLSKSFGAVPAVRGIDFTIAARECFGFLGPNGAGKTTTMRMLGCQSPRAGGELTVLGMDPEREPRQLKRRLGVVPQEANLDLELTVRENLLVYARYFDIPKGVARERADALLAFVQLGERADDEVDRLSGGMKRRLQIARALINAPDLILLDEPTTGLDPQARHLVWERLRELKRRGTTLVLTTHYMDEAAQLCDRLVIMDDGRIVREGAPAALVAEVVGREVLELRLAPADMTPLVVRLDGAVRGHQAIGDLLLLFTDDAEALGAAARATGTPLEVQSARR
ncbi:MAG: lipooligosaccharide transport system ATP-binding protein, partial [Miltoncostaeaceae bacterium]|nr:lipooligosaccharide transport system ATP-binding protein [Miltoncostaeaceae bacterium]